MSSLNSSPISIIHSGRSFTIFNYVYGQLRKQRRIEFNSNNERYAAGTTRRHHQHQPQNGFGLTIKLLGALATRHRKIENN